MPVVFPQTFPSRSYGGIDRTRRLIVTLDTIDMFLSLQIGFSFDKNAVTFEQSSRYSLGFEYLIFESF